MKITVTVGEKKDWTKYDFRSKTTLIRGGVCRTWVNPPFCKMATIKWSQMAKYQTLKTKISYNRVLNKFLFSKFATSPFNSIWLKISMNWHTKSQGPKKKCANFSRGRIHSYSAGTARNQGSFTSMAQWSVQSFLSTTVCIIKGRPKHAEYFLPALFYL